MPPAARKTATTADPAGGSLPSKASPLEPKIAPVILDDADLPEDNGELVELVRINGKPLHVPARPSAGLALQVLDDIVEYKNEGIAALNLLRTLLGEEQWAELRAYPKLKSAHLKQLAQGVYTLTMGALDEDDPGN